METTMTRARKHSAWIRAMDEGTVPSLSAWLALSDDAPRAIAALDAVDLADDISPDEIEAWADRIG